MAMTIEELETAVVNNARAISELEIALASHARDALDLNNQMIAQGVRVDDVEHDKDQEKEKAKVLEQRTKVVEEAQRIEAGLRNAGGLG